MPRASMQVFHTWRSSKATLRRLRTLGLWQLGSHAPSSSTSLTTNMSKPSTAGRCIVFGMISPSQFPLTSTRWTKLQLRSYVASFSAFSAAIYTTFIASATTSTLISSRLPPCSSARQNGKDLTQERLRTSSRSASRPIDASGARKCPPTSGTLQGSRPWNERFADICAEPASSTDANLPGAYLLHSPRHEGHCAAPRHLLHSPRREQAPGPSWRRPGCWHRDDRCPGGVHHPVGPSRRDRGAPSRSCPF